MCILGVKFFVEYFSQKLTTYTPSKNTNNESEVVFLMNTTIKAKNYTPLFVDNSVLGLMKKDAKEGDTFDFTGVNVMDRALNILAEILIDMDIKITGLDEESKELLETYLRKISDPEFDDIDEYIKMFKAKFPIGSLCIWDKTLVENLPGAESKMSIIAIEGIYQNFVRIRLYKSYLMEPRYVSEHGGLDNRELYTLESFHISDFISKHILFRYPRNEIEEITFDLLQNIQPSNAI